MKKFFAVFFAFVLGVSLVVTAKAPREVLLTYYALNQWFKDLVAENISSRAERSRIASEFRRIVITERANLKVLLQEGKIGGKDFFEIRGKYASLFVKVCEWKLGRF